MNRYPQAKPVFDENLASGDLDGQCLGQACLTDRAALARRSTPDNSIMVSENSCSAITVQR